MGQGKAERRMPTVTTLCYVEREDSYLMLHRVKKENDVNKDKWIGIGGHVEAGESPEECIRREAMEEAGLELSDLRFRGLITFCYRKPETKEDIWDDWEYMCLFTAKTFVEELPECNEGELVWVKKNEIPSLKLWKGDLIFFDLLQKRQEFFSLKLCYHGDDLIEVQGNEGTKTE